MSTSPLTLETIREIVLAFPGVEEGFSYRTVAFRVNRKLIARMHQEEPAVVVRCDSENRDQLMLAAPEVFYITPHYIGSRWVLLNLNTAQFQDISDALLRAYRMVAPPRLLKELKTTNG